MPGWLLVLLAAVGWLLTAVLVRLAHGAPRSGPLTERAAIGVILELFVTVFALVSIHRDLSLAILDNGTLQTIVRVGVTMIGLIPAFWIYQYLTGRLGR